MKMITCYKNLRLTQPNEHHTDFERDLICRLNWLYKKSHDAYHRCVKDGGSRENQIKKQEALKTAARFYKNMIRIIENGDTCAFDIVLNQYPKVNRIEELSKNTDIGE